jgi:hypothetical protein
MAQPTQQQFAIHLAAHPGARIVNFPTPGGPQAPVRQHDIIPGIVGWHIAVKDHFLPVQGYPVGYSDDNVHFSLGPSSTGAGVPGSQLSDGRISGGASGTPSF